MVERTGHDCRSAFAARKATLQQPYHFVDSGLPNVYLAGIKYRTCKKCGKQSADIPAVKGLMVVLGRIIVETGAPLSGAEIRFLRKRLGKKSAEFANIIGVSPEQVSRWENEHFRPEKSADKLIRIFYSHESGDRELKKRIDLQIAEYLIAWAGEGRLDRICAKHYDEAWEPQTICSSR